MEHIAKNICRTVISGEEQNLNKQVFEFIIFILFQYFICTFCPNSILFQGLQNRFHNSILLQYFPYHVGTLMSESQSNWHLKQNGCDRS